jgi:hypothetical protein
MEGEQMSQRMEIACEEVGYIFCTGRDLVSFKDASSDPCIGSSCDFDSLEVILDTELGQQSPLQRFLAGTATGEESAINVEQEEFHGC